MSGGADGQEDESYGAALRTLAGEPYRGNADLVHLAHPVPERLSRTRGSQESWELRRRYMLALHKSDAMQALVKEARESYLVNQ